MDQKKKKRKEESRISEEEEKKKKKREKQSIPEEVKRYELILWPDGNCRLIVCTTFGRAEVAWDGSIRNLADRVKQLSEKGVSKVDVRVASDGTYFPCPAIDTVETLVYSGHFDYRFSIDFPMEALALPRLTGLQFHWINVRSLPPEILETKLEWICAQQIQDPPLFLLESPRQIKVLKPWPWEPRPKDVLQPFKHLRQLLLLGLGEEKKTPWTSFLKLHRLYDPRLFLLIAEFLK